jgi:hypothetical protein
MFPKTSSVQCSAITVSTKERCKKRVTKDTQFCSIHIKKEISDEKEEAKIDIQPVIQPTISDLKLPYDSDNLIVLILMKFHLK